MSSWCKFFFFFLATNDITILSLSLLSWASLCLFIILFNEFKFPLISQNGSMTAWYYSTPRFGFFNLEIAQGEVQALLTKLEIQSLERIRIA
jgi:hypothetical protein